MSNKGQGKEWGWHLTPSQLVIRQSNGWLTSLLYFFPLTNQSTRVINWSVGQWDWLVCLHEAFWLVNIYPIRGQKKNRLDLSNKDYGPCCMFGQDCDGHDSHNLASHWVSLKICLDVCPTIATCARNTHARKTREPSTQQVEYSASKISPQQ